MLMPHSTTATHRSSLAALGFPSYNRVLKTCQQSPMTEPSREGVLYCRLKEPKMGDGKLCGVLQASQLFLAPRTVTSQPRPLSGGDSFAGLKRCSGFPLKE